MGREITNKKLCAALVVDCGIYISVCLSVYPSNYLSISRCTCDCCAFCMSLQKKQHGVDDIIYD